MLKTTIVVPTYNEIENLPLMVQALFDLSIEGLTLLVVDDNSPDGTGQLADELAEKRPGRIDVLHRTEKAGLGPAYIAGFKRAIAAGADRIVQMDCDFSHQPKYIADMIAKMEDGADMVMGSRFIKGGSVDPSWGLYRKFLSLWANRIYVPTILRIPINDATGGYRLWRKETLIGLDLNRIQSNGYVFQVEMVYVTTKLGFKVAEIPIHFPDRERGESKMDSKIAREAAKRVFEIRRRHRDLTPDMRCTESYH
jgi:dolichol-phosphate mannosyltransferase